jgi:hypothetical protein
VCGRAFAVIRLVPHGFLLLVSLLLVAFLGVVGVSAAASEHAITGGYAVTGFPDVAGVFAVGSVPILDSTTF